MEPGMTVLEARNICKRYKVKNETIEALKNVSISLEEREILGIVGESGSGKSTLLKMLSGLESPDSGEILLFGKTVSEKRSLEERRAMQMIFQDAGGSFNPRRKISSSVKQACRKMMDDKGSCDIAALAERVGLSAELADRFPGDLSGGQCQRMAIARAVAVSPRILLCDEITSALDVSSQAQILQLLSDICREDGMSVIFVSHDLAVVSCLCSRVVVMKDGAVVEEGPVRDIIERPVEEYTRKLIASVIKTG